MGNSMLSDNKKKVLIITVIIAAVVIAIAAIVVCCFNAYKDPRLKNIFRKFDIGCAISGSMLSEPELLDIVREQFTIITPENELKPD